MRPLRFVWWRRRSPRRHTAAAILFRFTFRSPDLVQIEVSPAAAICALRVAGNLACTRPFRQPGGLKARLQPGLAATQLPGWPQESWEPTRRCLSGAGAQRQPLPGGPSALRQSSRLFGSGPYRILAASAFMIAAFFHACCTNSPGMAAQSSLNLAPSKTLALFMVILPRL